MTNKYELALEELQDMVSKGTIKLTDNEYECFFVYFDKDRRKYGLSNTFEVEVNDGWYTYTLEGEVHEEGTTLEELGKRLLDWITFGFNAWKNEEFRIAKSNQEQEERDIYYMQHIR